VEAPGGIQGGPRPANARELQALIRAEREEAPFLVYREGEGELRIFRLGPEHRQLTIGRSPSADLTLRGDDEVSALHAVLEQLAGELLLVDDGLSRNGSFVNGERVRGRQRLRNGDVLRLGRTLMSFRIPQAAAEPTLSAGEPPLAPALSQQQLKVLVALCRPMMAGNAMATPATNQEIADALFLTVAAVKVHLRALFAKFGVAELPQNRKRLALVALALQSGVLSDEDRA
jgi:DNA-binding CsgD family transcriptional regulator